MAIQRETANIVEPFSNLLKTRGWTVHNLHGNAMQMGQPDCWCHHPSHGIRFIEFKVIEDNGRIKCTPAQKITFPKMIADNVPLFAVCAPDLRGAKNSKRRDFLYRSLFKEPNGLWLFEPKMWGHLCPVGENK